MIRLGEEEKEGEKWEDEAGGKGLAAAGGRG